MGRVRRGAQGEGEGEARKNKFVEDLNKIVMDRFVI